MDVVKSVVERLGGAVRVQSELNKGTTMTLNLPLSLALLRVVLLEAGDELFALPTAAIRRILHVSASDIGQLQQGPMAEMEGENIPLTSLSACCRFPPPGHRAPDRAGGRGQRWTFGIMVDAVHEEQDSCSKSCADLYAIRKPSLERRCLVTATSCRFSTSTRCSIFVAHASIRRDRASRCIGARRPSQPRIGCRRLAGGGRAAENILLAAGYESEIAADGLEALGVLASEGLGLGHCRRGHAAMERVRAHPAHPRRRAFP